MEKTVKMSACVCFYSARGKGATAGNYMTCTFYSMKAKYAHNIWMIIPSDDVETKLQNDGHDVVTIIEDVCQLSKNAGLYL